ncbi:MAG TPA: carboxypeptidase-like regulatory domain-containing protein, partial [Chitinophagaceae bacterium]|nr:carboxypeptidase-like regulatory domain-containing protein [Chitinophagaceae bacterium]
MNQQLPVRNILLFSLLILFSANGIGQAKFISGQVQDANSEEKIPFASVRFGNSTVGKLTDSAGQFRFYLNNWPSDTLLITCVGYQPFRYIIPAKKDSIHLLINMERGTFSEAASVKVWVNKGLLVWRKIVQHKPE